MEGGGPNSPLLVVGVDGSENSRRALLWAAEEARIRAARLRVVHAWWAYPMAASDESELQEIADARRPMLDFITDTLGDQIDVGVEVVPVQGRQASAVLIDASKDADLLVLGSRGVGGFSGLLLGSVSQQCVHHAHCPVVIVRPEPNTA